MAKKDKLAMPVDILLIISALVHGLLVFGYDFIDWLITAVTIPMLAEIIYVLVGAAGVYKLFVLFKK